MQSTSLNPFKRNPHAHLEIHKPGWKKWTEKSEVQFAIVVLVLIGAVFAFRYVLTNEGPQLILNALILHGGKLDVIKRSTLITQTDELARKTGDRKIINEWKTLSACVPNDCPDSNYFNFIITVTENENVPNSDLILNLIRTYKYWNSPDDILDFSKALTEVNSKVDELGSRPVTKAWAEIVKCNGQCSTINDLYFDMIKAVVLEGSVEE
ncbi:hypothetical protein HY641_02320 [Candidatus Woesearchaeota archaeon]|nr:hypothetical protein [Candidatus Woesearchaeota archaeon]